MTPAQHISCLTSIAALDPPAYNNEDFGRWCQQATLTVQQEQGSSFAVAVRPGAGRQLSLDTTVIVYLYEFVRIYEMYPARIFR